MEGGIGSRKRCIRTTKIIITISCLGICLCTALTSCIIYRTGWPLLSILCLILAPICIRMCYEDDEVLFDSDLSAGKDFCKGLGYVFTFIFISLAFFFPVILSAGIANFNPNITLINAIGSCFGTLAVAMFIIWQYSGL